VFPEMGSTLALDDVMLKNQAQELYDRAIGAPQIWDVMEAARRLALRSGVDNPEKLLAQPMPPPKPEPKINFSAKLELDASQQAEVLQAAGINPGPPEATDAKTMMDHVKKAADAADAAQRLMGEHPEQDQGQLQ